MRTILFILCCLWGVSGCQSTSTAVFGPKLFADATRVTLLAVAYEPELAGVLSRIEADPAATISKTVTFRGITYRIGQYHDMPIVVFATGISIPNAAMSMQMALDYFPVRQVIFMGVAGAINPRWHPGDVVIPARWYYHDESIYAQPSDEGQTGYRLPAHYQRFVNALPERQRTDSHLPDYQPFGMIHPYEMSVSFDDDNGAVPVSYFEASDRLLAAARRAVSALPPQAVTSDRNATVHIGGNGVSGSVFVDNRDYRKWIEKVYHADIAEMESAAVAQVCAVNTTPWIIVRAVSDLAGGQEGVNTEDTFAVNAAHIGANVAFALLNELAGQP
ncbi:5'-methylthioadenosine/S-adenosylhomocysteine nucleosidase [Alteromonas sp. CYL-A6]|uniref:5'-methylthioadenosine/S-adenosylhomocysteine nucleosidase n=1 Tax=Alteromonas nitratireducens TaxID=3390813 RepID=UPI0034B13CF7